MLPIMGGRAAWVDTYAVSKYWEENVLGVVEGTKSFRVTGEE